MSCVSTSTITVTSTIPLTSYSSYSPWLLSGASISTAKPLGESVNSGTLTAPTATPPLSSWLGGTGQPPVVMSSPTRSPTPQRTCDGEQTTACQPATTHEVAVGAAQPGQQAFFFNPNHIEAAVGDVILFRFLSWNHTVTQSSLEAPCQKIEGFDSGFSYFNPANQTGLPEFTLPYPIRNSEPVWFFCRQSRPVSHCHGGMVFGLNAGDKMQEFINNALGPQPQSQISSTQQAARGTHEAITSPSNGLSACAASPSSGCGTGIVIRSTARFQSSAEKYKPSLYLLIIGIVVLIAVCI